MVPPAIALPSKVIPLRTVQNINSNSGCGSQADTAIIRDREVIQNCP